VFNLYAFSVHAVYTRASIFSMNDVFSFCIFYSNQDVLPAIAWNFHWHNQDVSCAIPSIFSYDNQDDFAAISYDIQDVELTTSDHCCVSATSGQNSFN
jgi:hypothetical protein